MNSEESVSYQIEEQDGRYRVVDEQGYTHLECQDEASARHYAELMNKAWRGGFRAGYRAAKQSGNGRCLQ